MIDTVQIVLLVIILTLSILLIILGIQVFFILKDFSLTVKKTNKILDDTSLVSGKMSGLVVSAVNFADNISTGSAIGSIIKMGLGFLSKSDNQSVQKKKE